MLSYFPEVRWWSGNPSPFGSSVASRIVRSDVKLRALDPHMAPYGACKSYKAEFEEVQHSEGQISKTIEQSRRKERREKRRGKKEKRSEKLC